MDQIHRLLGKLQLVVVVVVLNSVADLVIQEDLVVEHHIQVVVDQEHLVREIQAV